MIELAQILKTGRLESSNSKMKFIGNLDPSFHPFSNVICSRCRSKMGKTKRKIKCDRRSLFSKKGMFLEVGNHLVEFL